MIGLLNEILPPFAFRALQRSFSEVRFAIYPHKDLLRRNHNLKDRSRGRRAFLLATGPSLKQETLNTLAGEDCFSVSNFFLHDALEDVCPKYHFFAPWHEPLNLENYIEWLRLADCKLPSATGMFLGHETLPLVRKHGLFKERDVRYLYLANPVNTKNVDLCKPVLAPQTGVMMILPVLVYMGYSEIYLLGCDHTVLRDYGGRIENFYDDALEIRKNATTGECWDDIVMSHVASMNVFIQYEFYKNFFVNNQVVVKNLSKDSWLDCFPYGDLDKIKPPDL